MRAKINLQEFQTFLQKIQQKTQLTQHEIATRIFKISPRTLNDWRRGIYTVSFDKLQTTALRYRLELPRVNEYLNDFWYTSTAGKQGGLAVFKKYGNIGTVESRKLGAQRAAATHRKRKTGFFIAKDIYLPRLSSKLAEFIGILLGDGGITQRQVSITLHKKDDQEYIHYVKNLCNDLFHLTPAIIDHKNEIVSNLVISRTKLVSFLLEMGLSVGSKVKNQTRVPDWIARSNLYIKHCIRGLLDTDGCVYIDMHRYKNKVYYNCAINFTNRSLPILAFFKGGLEKFGLHPTQKTMFSVFLRREDEILKYFSTIGSANPKHVRRFQNYFEKKYGGVPKRS